MFGVCADICVEVKMLMTKGKARYVENIQERWGERGDYKLLSNSG